MKDTREEELQAAINDTKALIGHAESALERLYRIKHGEEAHEQIISTKDARDTLERGDVLDIVVDDDESATGDAVVTHAEGIVGFVRPNGDALHNGDDATVKVVDVQESCFHAVVLNEIPAE